MTHARTAPASRIAPLAPDTADLDERSARAWTEEMAVRRLPDGRYAVESASGATYVVDLEAGRCTCPDHEIRGERCKHLRRVAIEVTRGRVPAPESRPECAVCGAPATTEAPPLCSDCRLEPGDLATDRETGGRVLVVAVTDRRADETPVAEHGHAVAEHATNRAYDPDAPVVEAVYVESLDGEAPPKRYAFPVSRLERVDAGADERSPERPPVQRTLEDAAG